MNFTQFMFPNGRQVPVTIDMPSEIERMAKELSGAGWRFEIECFPDMQMVNMDCCNDDGQLSAQLCPNGPEVPGKVVELVREAHSKWLSAGKPMASEYDFGA
jgi:hypothetical protein